jgi:hypothetical protein
MQYLKSVATTWQTTIEELSQSERKLLSILAWIAPEPIPLIVLEGHIVDGADARDALAGLASWSLARWMADGEGFTVHRLVQEITRQRLTENEKDNALIAAIDLLNARLPSPDWDGKGWQFWEQLASHRRALLDHLSGHVLEPKAVRIMNQYGVWLQNQGQYTNAEAIFQRALAITTKVLGKEHPDTLTSTLNVALTLYRARRSDGGPHARGAGARGQGQAAGKGAPGHTEFDEQPGRDAESARRSCRGPHAAGTGARGHGVAAG